MDVSNLVTLSGTIDEIVDCIDCAVNTILVRRELFSKEDFFDVTKYDVTLLKTNNVEISAYMQPALSTLRHCLSKFHAKSLEVVIMDKTTETEQERWQFLIKNVDTQQTMSAPPYTRMQEQLSNVLKYIDTSANCLEKLQMQCFFKLKLHVKVTTDGDDNADA